MKKLVLGLILVFITGCVYSGTFLDKLSYKNKNAVKELVEKASLKKDDTVIVATVANINDLKKSSKLGRTLSEQISAALVNEGIKVKELKFSKTVFVKRKNGEFMLSRDVKDIADKIKVNYVVAGVYSVAKNAVYVNLKIIDPSTDIIISSSDYVVAYESSSF